MQPYPPIADYALISDCHARMLRTVAAIAEELDPRTGAMLGNFQQALTHLSRVEAALALAEHGAGAEAGRGVAGV